ncbi:hypothetical protein FRX31_009294 [Thalictrum thalictroides]|uniref:Uncharacterized protein n=1 Tax=Thalictrum thalictroides TaxID=46969 RepID=A0A7J6WVN3_THATH|nr:hypothetical protein FRX31_009294 [Thalictrum thalictroides]
MTDDGYINFCFKDNGTFYIVKDQKSRNSDCFEHTSTRSRRKLIYEEEDVNYLEEDGVYLEASSERESYFEDDEKVGDEESVYFDPESPFTEISEEQYYKNEYHPAISHKSSTSNDSTSSFAFPVLNKAWSGSPIKMPRKAGISPKIYAKQKFTTLINNKLHMFIYFIVEVYLYKEKLD